MQKYTVTFQVKIEEDLSAQVIEWDLKDLIQTAVLPTLNLELVPLTFEVKRARK
jgi:hypothetical protein